MLLLFQYGVSKQGIAGLMDLLMAQGNASTKSKFLSLTSGQSSLSMHTHGGAILDGKYQI